MIFSAAYFFASSFSLAVLNFAICFVIWIRDRIFRLELAALVPKASK